MADTNGSRPTGKKHGTSYDLCKMTGEVDGKKQWQRAGTVFIRGNATGGVVYFKQPDGTEVEFAVFARKPRAQKPASTAAAA